MFHLTGILKDVTKCSSFCILMNENTCQCMTNTSSAARVLPAKPKGMEIPKSSIPNNNGFDLFGVCFVLKNAEVTHSS